MYVVLCNCPPDRAGDIARALVEPGLAACVNAIPGVTSTYRWEGRLVEDTETTLIIKVAADRLSALRERILAVHPYRVPEILALPIDEAASHAPYVAWVRAGG